ncbi:hypothetical protein T07_6181 [Trichinella nelsoni]|uniref:Uncharacterized protein n=1 Tax=Trichinella nelsoni TaxID=6336 RepID=A0A0V0RBQ4_9BILA|nr:hypothetical protein T07_6181 [Trichinella nelsoni]
MKFYDDNCDKNFTIYNLSQHRIQQVRSVDIMMVSGCTSGKTANLVEHCISAPHTM